jgi:hypothetical protein
MIRQGRKEDVHVAVAETVNLWFEIARERLKSSCPAGTAAPAGLSLSPAISSSSQRHEENGRAEPATIPPRLHHPHLHLLKASPAPPPLPRAIYPTPPAALKPLALPLPSPTFATPRSAAPRGSRLVHAGVLLCPRASFGATWPRRVPSVDRWRRRRWERCAAAEAGPTPPSGAPTVATHGE